MLSEGRLTHTHTPDTSDTLTSILIVGELSHNHTIPDIKVRLTCHSLCLNTSYVLFCILDSSHFKLWIPNSSPLVPLFTFSIFDRCPCRFGAFCSLPSFYLSTPPPCLFLICLCIYAHRSWPKVNREHTIAHSTDSTVIQPSGQDLSQTSNNMLNHWVF